jgi:hypothetical protein
MLGKLQTHGMGTALRILFSEPPATLPNGQAPPPLKLTRFFWSLKLKKILIH